MSPLNSSVGTETDEAVLKLCMKMVTSTPSKRLFSLKPRETGIEIQTGIRIGIGMRVGGEKTEGKGQRLREKKERKRGKGKLMTLNPIEYQ